MFIGAFKCFKEDETDYWRHFQKREALDDDDVDDLEDGAGVGETKVVFAFDKMIRTKKFPRSSWSLPVIKMISRQPD